MTLIAMKRGMPMREGGPTTADVDAAQVEDWRKRGWEVVTPDNDVDFDTLTLAELRALAKDNGINLPAAMKDREKIATAIRTALESTSPLA